MKSLEELLKQSPVFLNDWRSVYDVISDFEEIYLSESEYLSETPPYDNVEYWLEKKAKMKDALERYKDVNILFASYGCQCYEGDAFVLYEQENKLYEVNGGHCSCYGLEGQWEGQEVNLPELHNRLTNGSFGSDTYSGNEFRSELKEFLGIV